MDRRGGRERATTAGGGIDGSRTNPGGQAASAWQPRALLFAPGSGGLHMEKGSVVWKNLRISALEDVLMLEVSLE